MRYNWGQYNWGQSPIFKKNQDFALLQEGRRYFFIHKSGARVATDELGKAIWESLPGPAPEIIHRVKQNANEADHLVAAFLYVMNEAELVKSARGPDENGKSDLAEKRETGLHKSKQLPFSELVSVIIVTRNGEEHIKGCLESLVNQTYTNLEIIVVDNASKDRTTDIIRADFPQAKIFSLKRNIFFPGAVNYGLERARGAYMLILNDDLELEKDCIHHLLVKMKSEEKTGAVAPMMKFYHLRGFINGIGNHIRDWGWGSDNFIGCVDIGQFSGLKEVPSACFGAVFLNRKAVEEVGLLDRKYTAYYEDTDWSFRCWLKGWKIIAAPKAKVYHKFSAFWKTMGRKLMFVARNRLRLVLKIFQGRKLLLFLKRYISEDMKNVISLLLKGDLRSAVAYLRAYLSLFSNLPDIFCERKKIMNGKLKSMRENDILKKNPPFFSCLNQENIPVLNRDVMRSYYSCCDIFSEKTSEGIRR